MILQVRIKTFTRLDFTQFKRVTIKGCYLPNEIGALPEEYYTIKNVLNPDVEYLDGIYAMQCDSAWIDMRPQYMEKHILRVKGENIVLKLVKRV